MMLLQERMQLRLPQFQRLRPAGIGDRNRDRPIPQTLPMTISILIMSCDQVLNGAPKRETLPNIIITHQDFL